MRDSRGGQLSSMLGWSHSRWQASVVQRAVQAAQAAAGGGRPARPTHIARTCSAGQAARAHERTVRKVGLRRSPALCNSSAKLECVP